MQLRHFPKTTNQNDIAPVRNRRDGSLYGRCSLCAFTDQFTGPKLAGIEQTLTLFCNITPLAEAWMGLRSPMRLRFQFCLFLGSETLGSAYFLLFTDGELSSFLLTPYFINHAC